MTGWLLIVMLTVLTPQGGLEQRRIERPIANAQACTVALVNAKAIDYRPQGRVVAFEAVCIQAEAPLQPAPPPTRARPKTDA